MLRAIPYTSLWFGILVWVLFGGSISAAAIWWLYEDYLFAYESKPGTAIVERVYTTISHGRHSNTTTYHLAYHYQVGAMTMSCRTSVAYATYRAATPGERIPVLYIPAQLANNRIDLPAEQRIVRFTTWGLVIAMLAIHLIGALMLRYYIRQNRLYRFLLARGVTCQGIVDSVPYDLVNKGRTMRFYLMFTFVDSRGQSRSGRSWYLKAGDELRWRPDQPVQVYYDPTNSERFTVDLKTGRPSS
jgi:hypothetical protein